MRLLTYALIAVAAAVAPSPVSRAMNSADGYSRRVWQTQDGLPQDTINALVQTKDGYLWVGTGGGLARFDGFRFTIFNAENTPALREESVYSLYCARDGTLWIGTEGGGLVSHRAGVFRRFGADEGLTNGFVRAIREDGGGNLWVGTDRGLFRLDGERLVRVDDRPGVPSMYVHALYVDRLGRLWVGGDGLMILSDGAPAGYRSSQSFADNTVRAVAESDDGTIWVATIGGLHRVAGGDASAVFRSRTIINHNSTFLYRTKEGDMWAGTYGLGLFRYRGAGEPSVYSAPGLLPDNHILALLEDSEGNFWVGTQNGLLRLSRSVVSTVATGQPGAPESIKTVYDDRDGTIWLTTLSGGLYRLGDGGPVPAKLPGGVEGLHVRTVFRDRAGVLWVGTTEGVARVAPDGVTRYTMQEGLVNDFVRAFCESRDGSIWIGTDGGLSRLSRGSFLNFHTPEGLAYESIRALHEDARGNLWVATDGGVSRFHDGAMRQDPRLSALNGVKVWAIHEDADGGLWFATRGAGLFLLRQDRLDAFTTKHGLASNNLYQVLEDRRGRLWLSGPSGVFSVGREDLKQTLSDPNHRPAISLYGTSEGMETNQMNGGVQPAGTVSAAGEVWFPSTRGAVRIAPDLGVRASVPPVLIEQVLADGRAAAAADTVEVGPGGGRLEVHYTAVRLRSSERIRFRYILEGLDQEWIESGGRRVAYYTNLTPGSYRFRVAAYEADDPRNSSEATVGVRLRPHFYQTAWFAALCVALLAAAALAAYRLHVRQLHARFAAVLAERNRLAREMHDTLIQGCVGVTALLDAAASLQQSSPDMTRELLEHARTQVRESVDEARRAVWNLRHEAAQGEGIVPALDRLAQQIALTSGVRVACEHDGTPAPLDAQAAHDLVMIAKEAVLNAVHHGRPRSVRLSTSFDSTRLDLRVTDDGCGFDPSSAPASGGHYGLVGMSERAKQMGGTFSLRSTPGGGTQISVTVPVNTRSRAGDEDGQS